MARKVLQGIPVSAGISIGKAFFMHRREQRRIPRETIPPRQIGAQISRLHAAAEAVREDFAHARAQVPEDLKEHAAIIDSHMMICKDPKLLGSAEKRISEAFITAEWALEQAVREISKAFSAIEDVYIRERLQDVRVVSDRIMQRLLGKEEPARQLDERMVLMANDLTPADTIGLELDKIMSFCTAEGGKTSHTGILARSIAIPAIVGVTGIADFVRDGDLVIIDALKGHILVDPNESELADYLDLKYEFEGYQKRITKESKYPAETIDGYRLNVHANIELTKEVPQVLANGGEGVGLYRTEFAFLDRKTLPTEEELFEEYAALAQDLLPRKVVLRTLDVGADKMPATHTMPTEANPALGVRGIRYCMKNQELFRLQLRAILRASVHGNVRVMFPMISGLKELRQAQYQLALAKQELDEAGHRYNTDIPVGIMIELPSAVLIAESLAKEVDFFSIGTNDLIQYSLGIDRTNKHVSYLYQPLHPAILRSIKFTVDAAHREGIEVSVCGEVASDPFCVPILMGMQIDAISISPQAIPGIKRIIRQIEMEQCKELLSQVVHGHATVSKINKKVRNNIFKQFPKELTFFSSLLDQDE